MSQVAQRRTTMLASTAPIEPDAVSASSPTIEADAFTIGEFCKRNRISPPTYFKLRQAGLGPPEMRIGTVVRISREAAAAWRAARENPVGAEAEAVAEAAQAMRGRSLRAARGAVASPAHKRCVEEDEYIDIDAALVAVEVNELLAADERGYRHDLNYRLKQRGLATLSYSAGEAELRSVVEKFAQFALEAPEKKQRAIRHRDMCEKRYIHKLSQPPEDKLRLAFENMDALRRLLSAERDRGYPLDVTMCDLLEAGMKECGIEGKTWTELKDELVSRTPPKDIPPFFYDDEFTEIAGFIGSLLGGGGIAPADFEAMVQAALDRCELRDARDGSRVGPNRKLRTEVMGILRLKLPRRPPGSDATGFATPLTLTALPPLTLTALPAPAAAEPAPWQHLDRLLATDPNSAVPKEELRKALGQAIAGLTDKALFGQLLPEWAKARGIAIHSIKRNLGAGGERVSCITGVRLR